jgi:hypothetical protein
VWRTALPKQKGRRQRTKLNFSVAASSHPRLTPF